jgi:hypothetical protein
MVPAGPGPWVAWGDKVDWRAERVLGPPIDV